MINKNLIKSQDIQKKLIKDYWTKKISSIEDIFMQPGRETGPHRYNTLEFAVDSAVASRLKSVAKCNETNEYIILLAFFNILLYKYYGHQEIIVSSPLLKVEHDINDGGGGSLIFYKCNLNEYESLKKLLQNTRSEFHESIAYSDYDFKEFQALLEKKGIRDRRYYRFGFSDRRVNRESRVFEDVSLQLRSEGHHNGKLQAQVKYDKELFDEKFIQRFTYHYGNVLQYLSESLDTTIGEVEILSSLEKQELLVDFNDTAKEYPENKTIPGLFEDQVLGTPDNIAVIAPSITADIHLTYRDLNEKSGQLASLLREKGVEPDTIVGVMIERSIEMIIGILGILKAGGAYLPIDPYYPQERIDYMLKDSGAKILLTAADCGFNFHHSSFIFHHSSHSSHLAYLIYTSGSTGRPKGVMIEHASAVNLLFAMQDKYPFTPADTYLLKTSYIFDVSLTELFGWTMGGGRLAILEKNGEKDPQVISDWIERHHVTHINFVPSMFNAFVSQLGSKNINRLAGLKYIFLAGEALLPELVSKFRSLNTSIRLENIYGPTESSVYSSKYSLAGWSGSGNIPIGRPLPNIELYILNKYNHLQPLEIPGELCIGGTGLARGYLNRPELTAEKFIDFHHSSFITHHSKLYRTGDLARWLPDGNIQYLGRMDYQVKIRGHRIECGEIESKLKKIAAVKEAVVIVRDDKQGNKYLAAYFTAEKEVTPRECYTYLEKILPDFMIPAFFIQLKQLPLTTTGKIDRKSLPEPGADNLSKTQYEALGNEIEKRLAVIWQEVLNVDKIGRNDNFFQLGGNSLLGIRVANKIQEWLGEIVHVTVLFNAPTLKELAVQLEPYRLDMDLKVDQAKVAKFRKIIKPLPPLEMLGPKNPPAAFILSPPRCGTTLLRVILAGHPQLFAPPELELLTFNTLADRKEELSGKFAYFADGAIRAIMEVKGCSAEQALSMMKEFESRGLTSREFYRTMQQWLGNKLLVDKTPWYALNIEALKRAEDYFEKPRYLHLLRDPHAAIHSFENARLSQIFRYEHDFLPRELAELVWLTCNQNILEFLKDIPVERKHTIKFEELIRDPEPVTRGICNFLGIDYREEMIKVFENSSKKMTDGIHPESKMLGDVRFFTHTGIDPLVKNKWQEQYKSEFLGDITIRLAKALGYLEDKVESDSLTIESAPELEYYPLSPAQRRLWILDQFKENNITYNIPMVFRVEGDLNREVLEKAFEAVINRHESLRTTFIMVGGEPMQKIHDFESRRFKLQYIDLKGKKDCEEETQRLVRGEMKTAFDLQEGPLLKVILIRLEEKRYVLFFNLHHIICDGWSMRLLVNELITLYETYMGHIENPLAPMRFQYKDYSQWLNGEKGETIMSRAAIFWLEEFSGEIPVLNLPTDYPRPAIQSFEGNIVYSELSKGETNALTEIARSNGATSFMVLLALYNILLSKLSGQEDIIIGTPIAGRRNVDLEPIIGMFVNTLALRNHPFGQKIFSVFLKEVKEKTLFAFENQDYQFEELVEKVSAARDMSRNPLFDVMFVFQNTFIITGELPRQETRKLKIIPYTDEHWISKFDLTLRGEEAGEQFYFSIEYSTGLFKKETIERFFSYFKKIITSVIKDPGKNISEIEIVSEEEKNQVLYEFNTTQAEFPRDKTIHWLFEEQVEKTPDNIALDGPSVGSIHGSSLQNIQVTYREANEKSGRFAAILQARGIRPGAIVGIMTGRSLEMVTGILGILKAGGAYLPIDPDSPGERIEFMLKDSGAKLLVTTGILANLPSYPLTFLPSYLQNSSNLAYIIYTSGTTGKPKGVIVTHRSAVNYIVWAAKTYVKNENFNFPLFSSIAFDMSVTSLFTPLVTGNAIILYGGNTNEFFIGRIIEEKRAHLIKLTPSHLQLLKDIDKEKIMKSVIKQFIVGGEELDSQLAGDIYRRFDGKIRIYNEYGPTEAAVGCMIYQFDPARDNRKTVPVGLPIHNTRIYLADKYQKPVPIGVVGEIYISGDGIAPGYLNRVELTAEKFIGNPFVPGERMYRSGDLGRWLPGGIIEFLGRVDHQVKIRGYRIELGEIENLAASYNEIETAVVAARENERGNKYLCVYFTAGRSIPVLDLKEYLLSHLPGYMIPSYFVQLDKMPLTSNGKIDRKALPDPGLNIENISEFIPPGNDTEEKLAAMWSEILGIEKEKISVEANFFEIGGNSLFLIMLFSRVRKEFGIEIPITQMYDNPTIKKISTTIASNDFIEQPVSLLNRLNPKKIFAFPPQLGYGFYYTGLASIINDYSFYALIFIEEEDRLKKYVDIITGLQPGGPYIFFGHSAAGRLAVQVAKALEDLGYEVSDIIFADCFFFEDDTAVQRVEPDEHYEDDFNVIVNFIDEQLKEYGVTFLKDQVLEKTKKYIDYLFSFNRLETINSNINLILSETPRSEREKRCWEKYTTKTAAIYQGFGFHQAMLASGALEKNAAIVRGILNKIESERSSN